MKRNPSPETLTNHAGSTTMEYFIAAVRTIDKQFGTGYSKKHPELVSGFMQTAAMDYLANYLSIELCSVVREISASLDLKLGSELSGLKFDKKKIDKN